MNSEEEARGLIEKAGIILTDDELDKVAGGAQVPLDYHPVPRDGNGGGGSDSYGHGRGGAVTVNDDTTNSNLNMMQKRIVQKHISRWK